MLTATPAASSRLVHAAAVNCTPWSVYAALARTPEETFVAITAAWTRERHAQRLSLGTDQWRADEDTIRRTPTYSAAYAAESTAQAGLLRCIFGNRFRTVTIDPSWHTWQGGVVGRLAQAAYEDRRLPTGLLANDRLAILADGLEEAGCTNSDILGHLRGPGPHVRGCWVVDLLSGKS
jgi:hypothetical protein